MGIWAKKKKGVLQIRLLQIECLPLNDIRCIIFQAPS